MTEIRQIGLYKFMRIITISDTHGMHSELNIPDGDVLVHAGDLTLRGSLQELSDFNQWLASLPHKHKIVIAGNHDWAFIKNPQEAKQALNSCTYLEDSEIKIDGIYFYGSPWQPWFMNWAFNLPRGKALQEKWEAIPDHTDILITHTPPYGLLDRILDGSHVGCEELLERVQSLRIKAHIFGHIHENYGEIIEGGCKYVNASICTSRYLPMNQPVIIDI